MIAVGAVVLLLVLIGVAVFALRNALDTKPSAPSGTKTSQAATGSASGTNAATSTAAGTRSGQPQPTRSGGAVATTPTLQLNVTGEKSRVFVRIPGGDVLLDDVLTHGRHAEFDQAALDVVIYDGGAVRVIVNGKQRPPGKSGERVEFTARSAS